MAKPRVVYTTVDVNLSTRDFWSPAARMAAAEARKRHASASATQAAGRATGAAVRGKADAAKHIKAAAEAHAKVHGKEHGAEFQKAAHEHIARADRRAEARKRVLKSGRKIVGRLASGAMGAYERAGKL